MLVEATQDLRFVVLGSGGTFYVVQFGPVPSCDCPDHRIRGTSCKHLYFVKLRVLRMPPRHWLVYQTGYKDWELRYFALHLTTSGIRAPKPVLDAFHGTAAAAPPDPTAECPICYEPLGSEPTATCTTSCRTVYHASCVAQQRTYGDTQCALCRAE